MAAEGASAMPAMTASEATRISSSLVLRWIAFQEIADLVALQINVVAAGHLVETEKKRGIIIAQGLGLALGGATPGQKIGDAGNSPAVVEAFGLGQRQHGNVIGQRPHLIIAQLGGIGHDHHVIERAADAGIVEAAGAGGIEHPAMAKAVAAGGKKILARIVDAHAAIG